MDADAWGGAPGTRRPMQRLLDIDMLLTAGHNQAAP